MDDLAITAIPVSNPLFSGQLPNVFRTLIFLDYPGAATTVATGINPRGDIVGRYRDSAGKDHAFLLVR